MVAPLTVRRFETHEWEVYRSLRLGALADSPDAFGSTLAHEQARDDEHWTERLRRGVESAYHCPVIVEVDGEPAGLTWGRLEDPDSHTACLFQMWVDPRFRGRGAGRALFRAVIGWAESLSAHYLYLDVSEANDSARRLYERAGFEPHGEPKPLRPGSELLSQPMRLALGRAGA